LAKFLTDTYCTLITGVTHKNAQAARRRLGNINPLIDGFPTYWCWLLRGLNPDAWQFDSNLVAVELNYGVIWHIPAPRITAIDEIIMAALK